MSARKGSAKIESRWQHQLVQSLKNDLIAGLLVIIPLATTIWLTYSLATWVVDLLTRIPKQLNPFVGLHPFWVNAINLLVGLTVPLAGIILVGLMARNFVGQWLLNTGEQIVQSIPLAGAVYKTLKQLLETLLRDSKDKFRRVVLIEYPRSGMWSLAFVTRTVVDVDATTGTSRTMLGVFIPTTPNPTTGWYAVLPEADTIDLPLSVEDAFKLVVSGGIVGPDFGVTHSNKLQPAVDLDLPLHEPQRHPDLDLA